MIRAETFVQEVTYREEDGASLASLLAKPRPTPPGVSKRAKARKAKPEKQQAICACGAPGCDVGPFMVSIGT